MNSSNEFYRFDDQFSNFKENTTDEFKYNLITDSGDINVRSSTTSLLKEENLILSEKIDFKDLNSYESNACTTSNNLVLPQSIQNHIKSSNSFQQLWSSRIYSPKLIDSKISENILIILRSLAILFYKSIIITTFQFCYSYTKILRYNSVLFSLFYFIGSIFARHAYLFLDFLLIFMCIISILVASYEKWLLNYLKYLGYENRLINSDADNRFWKQTKLAAYGLIIGILFSFFI